MVADADTVQRWKAAKEARLREKKAKRMAFCTEVVDSLINLSEKVSKYREDTDSLVPKKQHRHRRDAGC